MSSAPLTMVSVCLVNNGRVHGAVNLLEGGEGQPQEEDKLEGVVEGEPVDDADKALNDAVVLLVCSSHKVARSRDRPYVKNEKTTQYYELVSKSPYHQ